VTAPLAMSRHSVLLLLIVVVGICIRFTYAATTGHDANRTNFEGEMAHNIVSYGRWFQRNESAENYITALGSRDHRLLDPASIDYAGLNQPGRWFPEIVQSVGVSAVIAGLWTITGDQRFIQIYLLQGIVDGLMALLVYWIAMQLFKRRRAAMIAAALYALYPPIAWETAEAYDDIWAVDFTLALLAIYLLMMRSNGRWRWLIACGVCAGLGAYFRPQVLLLLPALAIAAVLSTGWREACRRTVATVLTASLLLVPWVIRNYNDFHAFIPTRDGFWQVMWAGLDELPDDFGQNFSYQSLAAKVQDAHPGVPEESAAWDSYAKRYVVQAIERHPLFYAEEVLHRAATATVLSFDPAWMHLESGSLSHTGPVAYALKDPLNTLEDALEPAVFLLAMLSLAVLWRRGGREQQAILIAVVLCVLVPYIALHVEARFLLAAVPAYFIWIGLGADSLIESLTTRAYRWRRTTMPARRRSTVPSAGR
jgi:4-amino-4-deoxy-L-arabinose transferase-like glycosyltransferase